MSQVTFVDYLNTTFQSRKSGAKASYLKAIQILDDIFSVNDVFNLNNVPLSEIRDPYLIENIVEFVADEEDKFRRSQKSIFDLGKPTQTSYPRKRFCTAAIRQLAEFIRNVCVSDATRFATDSVYDGRVVSSKLLERFKINVNNTEKERTVKKRIGQDIFRSILLNIYGSKCCLTGIDIPEVLRASHIIPWAECEETRLNPQNGLCLSATYDAAFDKHLITFDENFRMVLSPVIKEIYTSDAFKKYFLKFEGVSIMLPSIHLPSQEYMEMHRSKLLV